MEKFFVLLGFVVITHTITFAASCPLTSDEPRLEYHYSGSARLICDYLNGRLQTRFWHNENDSETREYYSNGMPREYNLRAQNMGGGLYLENKKYNQSGMLISHYLMSGNYGFDCVYAGDYQLKCRDWESGIDYYTSVEYASQYEGN